RHDPHCDRREIRARERTTLLCVIRDFVTARERQDPTPWGSGGGQTFRAALRPDSSVRNLQTAVDDLERFAELRIGYAQRRVREEGVPADERVESFLAKELCERGHLVGRAVEG